MIIEKLTQFAEAVSVRLYIKRPAPMEQDWRLDNWVFPCIVAIPAQESETVQETSGRVERREFELMALRSVDVTFDTSEADASTEIARTEVLDFAQQMRGVFHVEHLGGRQIWDSANGELIVGWSLRLRLTELVGESACGGEPEPAEIEITENGTYNVLPFGRAVVDVQGGTPAVVEPLNVTPTDEEQTITPTQGVDGFAPVTVAPVTAAIDANITPANIKKDVEILGVTGTMEPKPTGDRFVLCNAMDGSIIGDFISTSELVTASEGCFYHQVVEAECRSVTTMGNRAFSSTATHIKKIILPSCVSVANGSILTAPCQIVEVIVLGVLQTIVYTFFYASATNLRHFEVGTGTAINLPLSRWTADDVIAEGQSGIDELNYNIKTYLADRVADRTNDTALTVTFGAALYNVLTADTIAAFTAKNWNVASA